MNDTVRTALSSAAQRLEGQSQLWKFCLVDISTDCTCTALAIQDALGFANLNLSEQACREVVEFLGLSAAVQPGDECVYFNALAEWNDLPSTTLDDAVSALRGTLEGLS